MTPEEAAAAAGPAQSVLFDVYEENLPVVQMFLDCSTQWHQTEYGPTGLRYESVLAVMDIYAVQDKRGMLDGLRIMERAALASKARN